MQLRDGGASRRPPILVTGAPRSGTTWLARLLAHAHGTALTGREPMNPRSGGYALAGTLDGWSRLTAMNDQQARALRRAYRGRNLSTMSRYGRRQWAAPLARTQTIVKDPFAVLSLAAISRVTGAQVVLLYRHPAAVLGSYRRMGWTPDLDEMRPICRGLLGRDLPSSDTINDANAFGAFWAALYDVALLDSSDISIAIVSHEELASGGLDAASKLFDALDMRPGPGLENELGRKYRNDRVDEVRLHDLNRDPAYVARQWHATADPSDTAGVEQSAGETYARLAASRLVLSSSGDAASKREGH